MFYVVLSYPQSPLIFPTCSADSSTSHHLHVRRHLHPETGLIRYLTCNPVLDGGSLRMSTVLVVGRMTVRRGPFLVRPVACKLILHYSWLACENRVAFRQNCQVTLSRPLGLSWEEGQEFFGCVMCGSQLHQHQLANKQKPFAVLLVTKNEF